MGNLTEQRDCFKFPFKLAGGMLQKLWNHGKHHTIFGHGSVGIQIGYGMNDMDRHMSFFHQNHTAFHAPHLSQPPYNG